jgi:SOS-response transcriptional repressor LexA
MRKQINSNRENAHADFVPFTACDSDYGMQPSEKVRAILKLPDWTQERLAVELGVAQSSVHRWLNGSEPRGDKRDMIVDMYDRLVGGSGPVEKTVRLAGYVGAAQTVYQFGEDGAGYVEAPPGSGPQTEAVEVRGDSMLPLYRNGAILYYSRQLPPDNLVGQECIVRLEDERILVKTLRRGSERGLWTLASLNAPDIEDVAVEWAAPIDWIKPR